MLSYIYIMYSGESFLIVTLHLMGYLPLKLFFNFIYVSLFRFAALPREFEPRYIKLELFCCCLSGAIGLKSIIKLI